MFKSRRPRRMTVLLVQATAIVMAIVTSGIGGGGRLESAAAAATHCTRYGPPPATIDYGCGMLVQGSYGTSNEWNTVPGHAARDSNFIEIGVTNDMWLWYLRYDNL